MPWWTRSLGWGPIALGAIGCGYPEYGFVADDATIGEDVAADPGVDGSGSGNDTLDASRVDTRVDDIGNDTSATDTTPIDTFVVAPDTTPLDTTPPPDAIPADGGTCPAGRTLCGGSCVDTTLDPTNCGGCGTKCSGGKVCDASACVCSGTTDCSGTCTDVTADPAHCGACTTVCAGGKICSAKSCVCPGGKADCGAGCVDILSDPTHCGLTCTTCAKFGVCNSGVCGCPSDSTLCGSTCVNTQGDPKNCGACGTPCSQDKYCKFGTCVCRDYYTACGSTCVDSISDPNNCGACGSVCTNICQGGSCVPTWAYTSCSGLSGTIGCGPYPPGGSTCVSPNGNDNGNCGGCGIKCAVDQLCYGGVCHTYYPAPGCTSCPCSACTAGYTCCPGTVAPLCVQGTTCT